MFEYSVSVWVLVVALLIGAMIVAYALTECRR